MPTISILTPAQKVRRAFVMEAGESIAAQNLPDGWDLEWVVQEDGEQPGLGDDIAWFPFARYEPNNQQLGEGQTRNLALTRAVGEFVHVLDSDDLLLPDAMATAINAFGQYPQIHWVAAQGDDLLADGSRVSFQLPIEIGLVEPGIVGDYLCHNHADSFLPVHTAGLTMRTTTTRALGGWGSYPRGADACLLAALVELTTGYVPPAVTWLYRKHPGQVTATLDWDEVSRQVAIQRITAIRELGLNLH
ncbi:Uncharacterised protein [Mycobacteroides abscessus subsp. bolletii]|uniref:glycosyltransferase n=1 Tax=Mycobacteroides abscessus TaxID=36809 RepID=UPI00092A8F5F|nr:glycosyltransferase [Mycobacteroides abscessus]MDO3332797.1 glycosyltransferase [Mycobacteroides abscessus subsp. bolletii]QSM90573.1 glycosyltransferase [Mycobacteroides abscessus subsp. bolletii]SHP99877.1 Uncharacterised protein [Mycobacteroides abscessus subsp. bolletii]SHR81799.1 Uncharacterised protein [Mycobacteroides abscessus subsp. bolletii]SHS56231.1 Uncharacterised protein [Mycobacteroides abscessus subsp. bolletii]